MADETMIVLHGFTEYEGRKRVRRAKGDEITANSDRADHLRMAGLARSKPKQTRKKDTEHAAEN